MSVVLQGWGSPFAPITQGYGAAASVLSPGVTLRETFRVPLPDGPEATRYSPRGQPPYQGSLEGGIAWGLDFKGWLGALEQLASDGLGVSCWAYPELAGTAPYDATSTVLQSSQAVGTLAICTLHATQAPTFYVVTVGARTTAGRTLECRMPRIWSPD